MSERKAEPVARTSADLNAERRAMLRQLFPEAFVEGKLDAEKLRATLGEGGAAGAERFTFTWAGRADALATLQTPSRATLVPCAEESVAFDTTRHLFVEGDNLEVLKLLYKAYAGKVKLIYIDPPYNTGQDFIYPDNFTDPLSVYLRLTGQQDESGNLLTSNPETSGRYHSAWLSMMYPRLFLARQLLRDDGVIFVSIDDHEVHHLRMVMNEIFGEENFVANIVWQKTYSPANDKLGIDAMHDYILCYMKDTLRINLLPRSEKQDQAYQNPDNDTRGPWKAVDATRAEHRDYAFYPITTPSGTEVYPANGRSWVFTKEELPTLLDDNRLWFGKEGTAKPSIKRFLTEVKQGVVPTTWWAHTDAGHNDEAKKDLKSAISEILPFSTPKPVRLIKRMVQLATDSCADAIVFDFFAGSSTTAQAVFEMNRDDGGNRKFVMVQLPEKTGDKTFPTIAEIGKERIRRVIAKLNEDSKQTFISGGGKRRVA